MEQSKFVSKSKSFEITLVINKSGKNTKEEEFSDYITVELYDANTYSFYSKQFNFTNLIDLDVNWKRCFDIQGAYELLETIFNEESLFEIITTKENCKISLEYVFIKSKLNLSIILPLVEPSPNDFKFQIIKYLDSSKLESESKIKNLKVQLENQISKTNELQSELKINKEYFENLISKLENELNINKENLELHISLTKELKNEFYDYKLKMNQISNVIKNSYKLSDKNVFNILHYSNQDSYSPTQDVLRTCANSIGVTFNIKDERKETGIRKENIDAVLVSTWSGTDKVKLGQDLLSYINTGVNIVILLFSNSTNYQPPEGINFIELKPDDGNGAKNWKKLMSDHPLFDGNPTVSVGSDKRRAVLGKIQSGSVDLVAEWEDGIPMMIVRKDLPGLVTQLGFQCGSVGSQDGLRVVINALRMIKC